MIQHVEEVTGHVAMTCRYFGISRHTYYRWLRRYEELGPEGLRERSHRPLVSPNRVAAISRSLRYELRATAARQLHRFRHQHCHQGGVCLHNPLQMKICSAE
jgi:transposase-like protein